MIKKAFLLCVLLFSYRAQACTCTPGLDTETLATAKNVFIFRLIRAEAKAARSEGQHRADIIGEIAIVDQLRGHRQFKQVAFSTAACCGARLDVGSYFLAAQSGTGSRFFVNGNDVIEVGNEHPLPEDRARLRAVLEGKQTLENAFPRDARERTEQFTVPPPCPRR